MPQKNRAELKDRFKQGDKPTQQDFSDVFESFLNIKEDWLKKPEGVGKPLRLMPQSEPQNWLDFCVSEVNCDTDYWRLHHQPPGQNRKPGFHLSYVSQSRLYIEKEHGKTGLGTCEPQAKLHVQPTAGLDMLRVGSEAPSEKPALLINAAGQVGIHQVNPTCTLDIQGEAQASGWGLTNRTDHWEKNGTLYQHNERVYLTTDMGLHLRRQSETDTAFHFDTDPNQRTLTIHTKSGDQKSIDAKGIISCQSHMTCQGGVQIKAGSAPAHWNEADGGFYRYRERWYLMVDNNLYFRKKGTKNVAFHFDIDSATLRANKFQQASDRRLKTNIKPLEPVLGKIKKLRGVYYEWRDHERTQGYSREPQIGFIADELQAVFPQLVSCDTDKFKYVDYGRFTVVLLEAMKQQQHMIETLQEQIAPLLLTHSKEKP
ncbi:MAG: hypothetical protein HamCj_00810 [Candidatus Hamiltonella defensa (Ceratovacuna japonica)]